MPVGAASASTTRGGGITTPQLTTHWIAWSTEIFRSTVSLFFTVTAKPVNGIGECGTNADTTGSSVAARISVMPSPVTNASVQIPRRGYSIATTRVYFISRSENMKSVTCLMDEYTLLTSGKRWMR